MEVLQRLRQSRMPGEVVNDRDIDAVHVPVFDGERCLGGVEQLQGSQGDGFGRWRCAWGLSRLMQRLGMQARSRA